MKLEINIADREEIGAAISLLQLVYHNTQPLIPAQDAPDVGIDRHLPAGVDINAPHFTGHGQTDPASVFGGTPAASVIPLPPGAPSTAAVAPLPSAPVAAPVGVSPTTGLPMPALPLVPVVGAPLAPATLASPASAVELDKNGLPWDERIHAGTKAKIADGSWRAKKGLNDPALVQRVEAELRARVAGGAAPIAPQVAAPLVPLPPGGAAAVPVPLPTPLVVEPAAAVPVPLPTPLVVEPAAGAVLPTTDPTTFEQLMLRLTPAIIAGTMGPTAANDACVAHGLATVAALRDVPQHIPQIWTYLKAQHPGLV